MTLEETLVADIEALKVVIACLVQTHQNPGALRSAAAAVLERHETTLLYNTTLDDAQIHRVRAMIGGLIP